MADDKQGLTYAGAGVDIDAGDALVSKIKPMAASTHRAGVASDLGGFGGAFDMLAAGYKDPILVSGTDGVGTKLRVALETGRFDTIGIDLVAMCVNDVLAQGAEPLFFLDYFATGRLENDRAADIISGIAEGCRQAGCALIGGETAEMPSMYHGDDFDLAGFVVGAAERGCLLPDHDKMAAGDILLGLKSSGAHSNGYSLLRKVVEVSGLDWDAPAPFDSSMTLGEAALTPTRIYVKTLMPLIKDGLLTGLAHITGGGLVDNPPRMLPKTLTADIDFDAISLPPLFSWLADEGGIARQEMLRTFNCGVGMVLAVSPDNAEEVHQRLKASGEEVLELGQLKAV